MDQTTQTLTAKTGTRCPKSGIWEPLGYPGKTAPIAINNVMPPYNDQAVIWILLRAA